MEVDELNEALISAVKLRRPLYDKSCDTYANRHVLHRQWKEIGAELGIDGNCARKKWTTLRDYFQKVHKQMVMSMTKPDSATNTKRKWYLYDSMKFLIPHVSEKKMNYSSDESDDETKPFSKLPEQASYASEVDLPTSQAEPLADPDMEDEFEHMPAGTSADTTTHACSSRKRKYKDSHKLEPHSSDSDLSDIMFAMKCIKATEQSKDEEELFLLSLAPKLRRLDPCSKLECQAEMQLLLLKYMQQSLKPQDKNHSA